MTISDLRQRHPFLSRYIDMRREKRHNERQHAKALGTIYRASCDKNGWKP